MRLTFCTHTSLFYLFYCDNNVHAHLIFAHLRSCAKCAKICTARKFRNNKGPSIKYVRTYGGWVGSTLLYITIAYYMQKKKGGRGVQIACKIAYVLNGRPPMTSLLPDDPRIVANTFNVLITLISLLFIHFLLHHRNILHRPILIYFVALCNQ